MRAARPEIVVHQLTVLPPGLDPGRCRQPRRDGRLRGEARAVFAARQEAGARRFMAQSIAFVYGPRGGGSDEDARSGRRAAAVRRALEAVRRARGDGRRSAARGRRAALRLLLRAGHRRTQARPDDPPKCAGGGFRSSARGAAILFIHIADAAAATVAALDRGAPDLQRRRRRARRRCASGCPPSRGDRRQAAAPRPRWLARLFAGGLASAMASELRGSSNAKARAGLGWAPVVPDWREGFREALG